MVYKWYILPIGGFCATYHLLGEPETTIELLRVRSGQFDMSLSGRVERSAWAKVQDVSTGVTPTNAATRLQALHLFLHIGAVTVLRSKTNLIEALTNHP